MQLVFATTFIASDGAIGVSPVRGIVGGADSATGFSAFVPFVHDALTAGWGMSYSHILTPFAGIVEILASVPI